MPGTAQAAAASSATSVSNGNRRMRCLLLLERLVGSGVEGEEVSGLGAGARREHEGGRPPDADEHVADHTLSMATAVNPEFDALLRKGDLIEDASEMTEAYLKELKHTLIVSGDTELISAPAYYLAARRAPSINAFMTGIAIIQDELAHAHIAYHILEELGEDQERLIFSRDPKSFRYPYAFDVPLESWTELVVANAFYDQAGFCLLGDIHEHCSYGPWKRGLVKVMLEENFHLRNGRTWMKRMSQAGGATKDELQQAVDWMFPLTVEWFGLPDSLKIHS